MMTRSRSSAVSAGIPLAVSRRARPVLLYLFITAVFFLIQQEFSAERITSGGYNLATQEIMTRAGEGQSHRRIALFALGIAGTFLIVTHRERRFRADTVLAWLLIGYLIWSWMSLVWAGDPALTFRRLMVTLMTCIGAAGCARRLTPQEFVEMVWFAALTYLTAGVLAEISVGAFRPWHIGYRFAGMLHPNSQGITCGLVIIAAVALLHMNPRSRLIPAVSIVVALAFLMLTKSRSAFASTAAAVFGFRLIDRSLRSKPAFVSAISIAGASITGIAFWQALVPGIRRVLLLWREDPSLATLTGRIPLWKLGWEYFVRRPFTGYGYNSFWTPERIRVVSITSDWGIGEIHSSYLETLLSLGIIGFAFYVAIIVLGMRRGLQYSRITRHGADMFFVMVLIFATINGLLESILSGPTFFQFVTFVALVYLGFAADPVTSESPS